jgi:hypothetical protein
MVVWRLGLRELDRRRRGDIGRNGATLPDLPPHGWGFGIGLRATPHPRRAISAFVQGELGLYRYDRSGFVAPLVAGRSGVVATAASGLSVEAGLKVQYMTSAEREGRDAGSHLVGTWQIGFGIPIS